MEITARRECSSTGWHAVVWATHATVELEGVDD
jgi:hypothetical protein